MTPENDYFKDVARMRRLLEQACSDDVELPDFLKPENQVVSEEHRQRSLAVRDALRKGDYDTVRELAQGLVTSGFDRKADAEDGDVAELDEARKRVRDRLSKRPDEANEDEPGDRDR